MATQVKETRNRGTDTPSSSGEEGLVKALIRGLVRTGGIYADARIAADQESNPAKREMREYAAEKAKLALLEDIAAANGYIDVLKVKIQAAKNGSNAGAEKEEETPTEGTDLQQAILEDDEEPSSDEAEEIVDPTVEEAPPEPEDESSQVSAEDVEEEQETETEDSTTQEEAEIAEETESVEDMFGLAKGTANAISEVLFGGSRNAIEPNERLNKRNLEKIALVLDGLDLDEGGIKGRTEAFLRHKGFDDEAIIEETIEAVLDLLREYQQDELPPEEPEQPEGS